MKRRHFNKICTSMIVTAATSSNAISGNAIAGDQKRIYQRCLLQSRDAAILTANDLIVGEPYLFFYPFVTTPCLLINLGKPITANNNSKVTENQQWLGGVGANHSIVAYSAICSHKMSHPAKEISFINYRHDPISFYSKSEGKSIEKTGLISCCSERSVYDPAEGAKVLGGPAPLPLAAIELEYDKETKQLYATGSYGDDMYDRFFDKFGFRASIEHEISDPKTLAEAQVLVRKLSDYSKQTIKC